MTRFRHDRSRGDDAKAVQGQLLVDVGEYHFDPLADRNLLVAGADDARGEPRSLVELDLHDVVRRFILEGREPDL